MTALDEEFANDGDNEEDNTETEEDVDNTDGSMTALDEEFAKKGCRFGTKRVRGCKGCVQVKCYRPTQLCYKSVRGRCKKVCRKGYVPDEEKGQCVRAGPRGRGRRSRRGPRG